MDFKHRVIFLSSIGFGVGVIAVTLITAGISTMIQSDGYLYLCSAELIDAVGSSLLAFVIQTVLGGLFGGAVMGASAVYSIENWGLFKCTSIHYVFTMTGYYILGFSMRWFTTEDLAEEIILFIVLTIGYAIIWLANYLAYKKQLNHINEELEELRESE